MINLFEVSLNEADKQSVANILDSGWIGPGGSVDLFEKELSGYTGMKHVVCCNSGTTALMLCMKYLMDTCKEKLEVNIPAYGMFAARHAANFLGINGTFRDHDSYVSETSKVVVAINHNGIPHHMATTDIVDACQSIGIDALHTPYYGHLNTLSFSPQKLVTCGQGGAVLTNDDIAATEIRRMLDPRQSSLAHGNFRMSNINAALGLSQLVRISQLTEVRKQTQGWYREELGDILQKNIRMSFGWCACYYGPQANKLVKEMGNAGVEAKMLYGYIHGFKRAKEMFSKAVYLPLHQKLTRENVTLICKVLNEHVDKYSK